MGEVGEDFLLKLIQLKMGQVILQLMEPIGPQGIRRLGLEVFQLLYSFPQVRFQQIE